MDENDRFENIIRELMCQNEKFQTCIRDHLENGIILGGPK